MKYLLNRVTFGTVAVCLMIILFTVFSIRTAEDIVNQSETLYQHPFRVRGAAQAMRTRLLEVRIYFLPALLVAKNTRLDDAYKMLDERDRLQDDSLTVIRDYYLGPKEDIAALVTALTKLRAARRQAVRECAEMTDAKTITDYLDERVIPLSYDVDTVLQCIAAFATAKAELYRERIQGTQRLMNAGLPLLCILLIALVIFVSVNERRKNRTIAYREQLFNLLSKSIDDVFFIYNHTDKHLEYVSENCVRLFGITPQELYRDSAAINSGLTPEAAAEIAALLADDSLTGDIERSVKFQRDYQTLDLKLHLYPIHTERRVRRSILMLSDQTQAIAQQAALSDALFSARKANEAKQEFLSRMSHEIRTPMNAIIGMTAIAMKYMDNKERAADCLNKIAISSKHLLSLINDVLDIAKIEEGKLSFTDGPFNFRNFINALTAIIYPQTIAHQQEFEITISGLSEETLIGDELRLNQILINLLSNAIKFTPPEGEIRLEITRLRDEGSKAVLSFVVRDTGIGMSQEFLARLYTPFEQADDISKNYGGTGLGLSITKNLVSLMSGNISVESAEGKGTTFTLELPFALPEREERPRSVVLSDLNVLVADDDQVTREHAMLLLEQIGVRGDCADSGEEALAKVTEAQKTGREYAVCLIDWRMPGMDGVETARRLREKVDSNTPIIIISSYDWTSIEKEAREAGVNAFISKPLFASSLYTALADMHNPEISTGSPAQQIEQYDFKGKKVLLAEDNPLNQEVAVEILQSAGLRVDCANDGQQALDMYLRSGADEYVLILMDVQMPRLNGYEATQAIRASNHPDAKNVPILAMTANAFSSDIHAAKAAGMNGHLAKPIDVPTLLRTITTTLKGKTPQNE